MRYKEYGKTGDKVSVLGFGAMRLPMVDDHVDMDLAVSIIQRALDLGVNYVDSAVHYCHGESQIAVGNSLPSKSISGWRNPPIKARTLR